MPLMIFEPNPHIRIANRICFPRVAITPIKVQKQEVSKLQQAEESYMGIL